MGYCVLNAFGRWLFYGYDGFPCTQHTWLPSFLQPCPNAISVCAGEPLHPEQSWGRRRVGGDALVVVVVSFFFCFPAPKLDLSKEIKQKPASTFKEKFLKC